MEQPTGPTGPTEPTEHPYDKGDGAPQEGDPIEVPEEVAGSRSYGPFGSEKAGQPEHNVTYEDLAAQQEAQLK